MSHHSEPRPPSVPQPTPLPTGPALVRRGVVALAVGLAACNSPVPPQAHPQDNPPPQPPPPRTTVDATPLPVGSAPSSASAVPPQASSSASAVPPQARPPQAAPQLPPQRRPPQPKPPQPPPLDR